MGANVILDFDFDYYNNRYRDFVHDYIIDASVHLSALFHIGFSNLCT